MPGGDYGEEAHWQRFVDAYAAQIRNDPECQPLSAPNGPCAATIAHLMGVAAHGMGDEVWDWLFEPNGPGFGEQYLPPEFAGVAGPGGLELQLDIVAIARHGRPTEPTVAIPDATKITAAFRAIGRTDIDPATFPQGEQGLEIERSVEALWAPAAHRRARACDAVDVGAHDERGRRSRLGGARDRWVLRRAVGRPRRPAAAHDGERDRATRRRGRTCPPPAGSGATRPVPTTATSGGLTRIAAALTRALPFHAQAGQGSVPNELPAGSVRLRDLSTGRLVPAAAGYPRIVPYNPEAGEHVVAFQPAGDLAACRWYRAETTRRPGGLAGRSVLPASWRFRTSGCQALFPAPVQGTTVCDATGATTLSSDRSATTRLQLTACAGGQDGGWRWGPRLPVVAGQADLRVDLPTASCNELVTPTGAATVSGRIRWTNGQGREVGTSVIAPQPYDPRGATVVVDQRSRVFPGHSLALRAAIGPAACAGSGPFAVTGGKVTAWP